MRIASPRRLKIRPSVAVPTGTVMPVPVFCFFSGFVGCSYSFVAHSERFVAYLESFVEYFVRFMHALWGFGDYLGSFVVCEVFIAI